MPQDTPNLKLKKPQEGSFGWHSDWYDNVDKLDAHPGILCCTSDTRPPDPWPGQVIFETNNEKLALFTGVLWLHIQLEAI